MARILPCWSRWIYHSRYSSWMVRPPDSLPLSTTDGVSAAAYACCLVVNCVYKSFGKPTQWIGARWNADTSTIAGFTYCEAAVHLLIPAIAWSISVDSLFDQSLFCS